VVGERVVELPLVVGVGNPYVLGEDLRQLDADGPEFDLPTCVMRCGDPSDQLVSLYRADRRAQQRGDVSERGGGSGLGDAGAAAEQVQPRLRAGDRDVEQPETLTGEAGPVGSGLGNPPAVSVVLDETPLANSGPAQAASVRSRRERCVVRRGSRVSPLNQASRRIRLRAAAMMLCSRRTFASPR